MSLTSSVTSCAPADRDEAPAETLPATRPVGTSSVGLIGYRYWCNVVAQYLDGAGFEIVQLSPLLAENRGLRRWRAMGRPPLRGLQLVHSVNALAGVRTLLALRLLGARVIVHWIGSDVRRLLGKPSTARRLVIACLEAVDAVHLFDSPELQQDLAPLGISGAVVRLVPAAVSASVLALPSRPAALAYWSAERADFYGRPIVYELARRRPDLPFRVVGPATADADAPPNVEFLGFHEDLGDVYRDTSVLIRILPHDSVSAMVVEVLARGRDVIYSRPFPHTRQATDVESAAAALAAHLAEYRTNVEGAAYVKANFAPRRWAAVLCDVYRHVLRD